MSRSGYLDEGYASREDWARYICYRGAVASAIRGKNGQKFLKEMLAALDALPEPILIQGELEEDGAFCALGAVGKARNLNMNEVDVENYRQISKMFEIPKSLAREIMYENDDGVWLNASPTNRFAHMRSWILSNLKK